MTNTNKIFNSEIGPEASDATHERIKEPEYNNISLIFPELLFFKTGCTRLWFTLG